MCDMILLAQTARLRSKTIVFQPVEPGFRGT